MAQMESPKRKMQKKNDYQRHKLFRKIKRRRKAQAEAEQHIAEKQLRNKYSAAMRKKANFAHNAASWKH